MLSDREKEWLKIRAEFLKQNPANHEGYRLCGICAQPVHISETEVDHIIGRDGTHFSDLSNLQPVHPICNRRKGSQKWKPKVSKEEYQLIKEMEL